MPFFHFGQNNSGGSFVIDHKKGISHHVIIEARDAQDANHLAEDKHEIYFNGMDDGRDCDCCGSRWSEVSGKGNKVPSIYGRTLNEYDSSFGFIKDGPEIYVHYLDGRMEGVGK